MIQETRKKSSKFAIWLTELTKDKNLTVRQKKKGGGRGEKMRPLTKRTAYFQQSFKTKKHRSFLPKQTIFFLQKYEEKITPDREFHFKNPSLTKKNQDPPPRKGWF